MTRFYALVFAIIGGLFVYLALQAEGGLSSRNWAHRHTISRWRSFSS